jgi:hypothetical protein
LLVDVLGDWYALVSESTSTRLEQVCRELAAPALPRHCRAAAVPLPRRCQCGVVGCGLGVIAVVVAKPEANTLSS